MKISSTFAAAVAAAGLLAPAAPPPDQIKPEVIDLEIDFDGTVVWNGTPVPNLETLEGYFHTYADKDPQPEIHLRPDRRSRYDVVAKVLAAAQRRPGNEPAVPRRLGPGGRQAAKQRQARQASQGSARRSEREEIPGSDRQAQGGRGYGRQDALRSAPDQRHARVRLHPDHRLR